MQLEPLIYTLVEQKEIRVPPAKYAVLLYRDMERRRDLLRLFQLPPRRNHVPNHLNDIYHFETMQDVEEALTPLQRTYHRRWERCFPTRMTSIEVESQQKMATMMVYQALQEFIEPLTKLNEHCRRFIVRVFPAFRFGLAYFHHPTYLPKADQTITYHIVFRVTISRRGKMMNQPVSENRLTKILTPIAQTKLLPVTFASDEPRGVGRPQAIELIDHTSFYITTPLDVTIAANLLIPYIIYELTPPRERARLRSLFPEIDSVLTLLALGK
ncbi:hypothetical protein [Candidatus Caldatribacterium sp.]|uniref:hypothetical protein n=1 Tax=Candidatus Caldatribacterium sp. TaxID=2282143 RepID=UPI003844B23D|nr:hypothetical protein [Candidatus Caldatribacterium sp.]